MLWSLFPSVWKVSLTSLEYVSTLGGRSVPQNVPKFISESLFELVRLLEIDIRTSASAPRGGGGVAQKQTK